MDKFLEKLENDLNKLSNCLNGNSIVKPFDKIFDEVRDKKEKGRLPVIKNKDKKYSEKEESIYKKVIEDFLKQNPEFLENKDENKK
jgi:hypothetical protein